MVLVSNLAAMKIGQQVDKKSTYYFPKNEAESLKSRSFTTKCTTFYDLD